ncbi:MAG: porphobilinogen synthase [Clostridiales bacterium]|jgi:porphobilinogen synthase|nr:porphobilinogen synthase [Clostridiales bacterium]
MNGLKRLRGSVGMRRLVNETDIKTGALVYPLFVREGQRGAEKILSMPGQFRYGLDRLPYVAEELAAAGVGSVLLFGVPQKKDAEGSGAYDKNGAVQAAVKAFKSAGEFTVITDVCLCEYTSHGHCGILFGGKIDNDATLTQLQRIAVSHAEAGADIVAPSAMADFQVRAIRAALDENGFDGVSIMSYSTKFSSALYGPFREAAGSAPAFGDRKSYQLNPANTREALRESLEDEKEGADILMVKPAGFYLDILSKLRQKTLLPIAAYSVSGEYAMIKAAVERGFLDEKKVVTENALSVFRAGADILITYYAKELASGFKGEL